MSFMSVPIEEFNKAKALPCNVYIKVHDGNPKLIFKKESIVSSEDVDRYSAKGLTEFYVNRDDFYDNFDYFFSNDLAETKYEESHLEMSERLLRNLHESLEYIGLNARSIQHAQDIGEEIKSKYKDEDLNRFFGMLKLLEGSYIYNHSVLTSILVSDFIKEFEWNSNRMQEEVVLAALIHDLGFPYSNRKLAVFESETLKRTKADQEFFDEYRDNLTNSLEKINGISSNVINIVRNHRFNRDGLPIGNIGKAKISKPLCAFVLCHELSTELLRVALNKDKFATALTNVTERFSNDHFKTILKVFKTKMIKQLKIQVEG